MATPLALMDHCFSRNIKILLTGMLAIGMPLGTQALETKAAEYHKVYGRDYVNLGYRPGFQAVIVARLYSSLGLPPVW